jgi:hypothetical protein
MLVAVARLNEIGIVALSDTGRQIGRFEGNAEGNGQELDARIRRNGADER